MTNLILVKSGSKGRMGLFERNTQHPNGEVFVKDKPMLVAKTPEVMARIKRGVLVECVAPDEYHIESTPDELLFMSKIMSMGQVIEIDGIGPKTAVTLKVIGIDTVGQLAESTIDHPLVLRWREVAQELIAN